MNPAPGPASGRGTGPETEGGMWISAAEGGYVVRLERGEELIAALRRLMLAEDIRGGTVVGLGTLEDPLLGYFDREKREYLRERVAGVFELLSLSASLSWFEGEPFPHVHVVLGDRELRAVGGHCFEVVVAVTAELRVWTGVADRIDRRMHQDLGLHLMELPRRLVQDDS